MSNRVLLKKSSVSSKTPLSTDLEFGELALNYADGKLYYKKSDGTTVDFFQTSSSASSSYQATLVSGTNIKTINSQSILGSGNITISGSGLSGSEISSMFNHAFNTGITYVYDGTNNRLQATIANAATLRTARTINGVSFDGSANITINAVDSTARVASSSVGVADGVASLDVDGKLPLTQHPTLTFTYLSNFAVSSPAAGQRMVYNGSTAKWSNRDQITLISTAALPDTTNYNPGEECVTSTGKQYVLINQSGNKFWLQRG